VIQADVACRYSSSHSSVRICLAQIEKNEHKDDEDYKEVSAPKRRKGMHAVPVQFVMYSALLAETLFGSFTPKAISNMDPDKLEEMADTAINSGAWNARVRAVLSSLTDCYCLLLAHALCLLTHFDSFFHCALRFSSAVDGRPTSLVCRS
jgi:hypothetical protein